MFSFSNPNARLMFDDLRKFNAGRMTMEEFFARRPEGMTAGINYEAETSTQAVTANHSSAIGATDAGSTMAGELNIALPSTAIDPMATMAPHVITERPTSKPVSREFNGIADIHGCSEEVPCENISVPLLATLIHESSLTNSMQYLDEYAWQAMARVPLEPCSEHEGVITRQEGEDVNGSIHDLVNSSIDGSVDGSVHSSDLDTEIRSLCSAIVSAGSDLAGSDYSNAVDRMIRFVRSRPELCDIGELRQAVSYCDTGGIWAKSLVGWALGTIPFPADDPNDSLRNDAEGDLSDADHNRPGDPDIEYARQTMASSTPSLPPYRGAMPSSDDLGYAEIQVWHNPKSTNPKSKRGGKIETEWKVKIRSASFSKMTDGNTSLDEHYLSFAKGGPRRLKERITKHLKTGMMTNAFYDEFNEITQGFNANALMALVSRSGLHEGIRKPGQSSKARVVSDGQWAVLNLNSDKTAPVSIDLYLNSDQPIRIVDFKPQPAGREARASDFYTYFDPYKIGLNLYHDKKAAEASRQRQQGLADFHPVNVFTKIVKDICQPIEQRFDAEIGQHAKLIKATTMQADECRAIITTGLLPDVTRLEKENDNFKEQVATLNARLEKLEAIIAQMGGQP